MKRTLGVLTVWAAILSAADKDAFTFTKTDLSVLEQADLTDKKLEKEGLVYHEDALSAYVTKVGMSMLPAGTAPERVKWEFHVLRDPIPNAFALPNGSIYINTGLLSLVENEDQLASVLAHEITHVTDRHPYLHFRDYRKKAAVANIASYAASIAPGGGVVGASIRLAGTLIPIVMVASINGYSKELEKEADLYSFNKLIEGNYDPREMPNTFRLLQRKDEVEVFKIYYTDHPKLEDRVSYISSLVSSKSPAVLPADLLAARRITYLNRTENVVREDIHLAILSHRARTALARASKLIQLHSNPDNLFFLGEAYLALGPRTPKPTEEELGRGGKRDEQNMMRKFTPDEEERDLLAKGEGQKNWQGNQQLAEEAYRKALAIDANHAKSYRGLGQLYEKQSKNREALVLQR
jgi:Zn-dependent protease with chaperone function